MSNIKVYMYQLVFQKGLYILDLNRNRIIFNPFSSNVHRNMKKYRETQNYSYINMRGQTTTAL